MMLVSGKDQAFSRRMEWLLYSLNVTLFRVIGVTDLVSCKLAYNKKNLK